MNYKHLWIFSFILRFSGVYCRWLEVRLPDDAPRREGYVCTYERLPVGTAYAVRFLPQPIKDSTERMYLFGCSKPRHFRRHWECGREVPPCEDENERYLIFAWTKNVQNIEIPENVGFKLGSYMKSKYIVMQVHYSYSNGGEQLFSGRVYSSLLYDNDRIDVYLTSSPQKYLAGTYSFSSKGFKVSPSQGKYNIDIGCRYDGKRIAPFAYRCEADEDGQSVSAYRVRVGSLALIGEASLHGSQGLYSISDEDMMVIKPGDYLAVRCIYDDVQNLEATENKNNTKMCNFYFMYYMLNKNIPPHQYEEQCDTLIQNVMEFPSKGESVPLSSTMLPTAKVTTIKAYPIVSKNNLIKIQNLSVKTSNLQTRTRYVKTVESKPTHSTSIMKTETKLKILVDPSSFGPKPTLIDGWPTNKDMSKSSIRNICSVGLSKNGDVFVLHRASRKITVDSFDDEHYYTDYEKPVQEDAIEHINSITGKVLSSFGGNIFYLPHSLTIDDDGNYWITDIALHQVLKFSSSNTTVPSLTLGVATIPGSDDNHFCKPTDVSVDKYGNIFVADGYCNSRIMKYDKNGNLIKKWGTIQNAIGNLKAGEFITPHSLSIDNKLHHLYVADFQTGNIIKFDTDGNFVRVIKHMNADGKLYSINFNHAYGGIIYTLSGLYGKHGTVGHIISTRKGEILTKWNIVDKNVENPLDVIASKDNTILYISINYALWKFNVNNPKVLMQNLNKGIISDNGNYYSEIKIIKPFEDDKSVVPAVIVVTILAIPVFLAIVTMVVRNVIHKFRHNKISMVRMHKHRFRSTSNNEVLCYGCCITRKHFYDGNRGIGNFMTGFDEGSDCDEEDLFTGKA